MQYYIYLIKKQCDLRDGNNYPQGHVYPSKPLPSLLLTEVLLLQMPGQTLQIIIFSHFGTHHCMDLTMHTCPGKLQIILLV